MPDAMHQACPTHSPEECGPQCTVRNGTDGRTKTPQDRGDNLTFLDACDNGAIDASVQSVGSSLPGILHLLVNAPERLPVSRIHRDDRQLDPQVRKMVLLRDGFTCQWCKAHIREGVRFQVDHIVPWSAGGSNATDNLRALCEECNQKRSNFRTDSETATARLIVGSCPWCRGRHYVRWWESETGKATYVYDEDAPEISPRDREVPVWCIGCRAQSSTSVTHADEVRAKQADRYAAELYETTVTDDLTAWSES